MADTQQLEFGQRLRRIDQTHRKLSRGYVTTVESDGLIVAKPQRQSSHIAARSLFAILFVLLAFKVFLYAQIGATAYDQRLAQLENGSFIEKMGAYVMYPDPLTVRMAGIIAN